MKKLLMISVSCVMCLAISAPAGAELIAMDQFVTDPGYTVDASIVGQNPPMVGFEGVWRETTGDTNKFEVQSTGLDAGLGYEAGGAVAIAPGNYAGNNVIQRDLANMSEDSVLYFSGMISVDKDSTSYQANGQQGFLTFAGNTGLINLGFRGQDGVGRVAMRAFNFASPNYSPITIRDGYAADEILHFIAKIVVDASGDNEQVTVMLNPSDVSSESQAMATSVVTPVVVSDRNILTAGSPFSYFEISVNNMPNATVTFDEVMLGDTFGSVVAVPEPGMLVLLFTLGFVLAVSRLRSKA